MIRVTIEQLARTRGIKKPYHLAQKTGISPSMAGALWKGERLPDLTTLDTLCEKLRCQIGDLVQYVGTRRPKSANGSKRPTS